MDQFIDRNDLASGTTQPGRGPAHRVVIVTRISTKNQDMRACGDSEAYCRQWAKQNLPGDCVFQVIASQGSGERLDRQELRQLEDMVINKEVTVVLCEEASRLSRRNYVITFCEDCEDAGIRFIAINDHVDTFEKDWRLNAFFASIKGELSNKDTSTRIRRTLRERFMQGGIVQFVIYGFIKPTGAKHDSEISINPAAVPIIDQMFTMLEQGARYSDVADWLNSMKVPVGIHCDLDHWTPAMVSRFVHYTELKGLRVRNDKMSKRNNKTGVYKSIKAPLSERLERFCPHWVIIEPSRYDRVIRILDDRNSGCCRSKINDVDSRANKPKKRSEWPGSHLRCGVCGKILRYGAHGMDDRLFCGGAYEYQCWNAVSVNGPLAADKMLQAILQEIARLPAFDEVLVQQVQAEREKKLESYDGRYREALARQSQLRRERQNLIGSLRSMGSSTALESELKAIEMEIIDHDAAVKSLEEEKQAAPSLPGIAELRQLAEESLKNLPRKSAVFGKLMREWVPNIYILPVRRWNGGKACPRAYLDLELVNLLPLHQRFGDVASRLRRRLVVDLFDPPACVRIREQAVSAKEDQHQRDIAKEVSSHQATVQHALRLHRLMEENNTNDPYCILQSPPTEAEDAKWRRHRHPRYSFSPLPGFPIHPN